MLTESFVVSLGNASDRAKLDPSKDVSIAIIDHLPVVQQRTAFKKSSSLSNCLAVSASHIFTAQIDKAVVHVYNREKGNQEATVPFTEKITCITLVCNDTVLALGTVEGRLFFWEIATGRQITTTQTHIQSVTCVSADPSGQFLISTSADNTARIWTLPALLSFEADLSSPSLGRLYDGHRAAITAVAIGHGASFTNIAVTIAQDRTCMIWDYHTLSTMYTFLLTSVPTCLTLDPADRAVYLGYDDGSVQQLDLLTIAKTRTAKSTGTAIQPGDSRKWTSPDTSHGSMLSISCTFDGTTILTGHQSGTILAWDVSNGHMRTMALQPPITRAISSLQMLPVVGFETSKKTSYRIETIVKPKFGAFQTSSTNIPGNYAAQAHLLANPIKPVSSFQSALTAPFIPPVWLEQGLEELSTWSKADASNNTTSIEPDDFMPLTNNKHEAQEEMQQQVAELQSKLDACQRSQRLSLARLEKMTAERNALLQREHNRMLHGADMEDR